MSLVHLTSVGQMPNQFSNHFSNGIQLGPYSEVALVGYSGNLAGESGGADGLEVFEIVINEGTNDTFAYFHGDLSTATGTAAGLYYAPQVCTVQPGIYSPAGFGVELQRALNASEQITQYKGIWLVAYDAVNFKYNIKCGKRRAGANNGGLMINYSSGGDDGVVNAPATSTLTPGASRPNSVAYIDTQPGYFGDTTIPAGSVAVGSHLGYEMEFTTVVGTILDDIAYSLCMVPKQMATKMAFSQPTADYPENSNTIWTGQTAPNLDFAEGNSGPELFGFCPHGITINPADGRFGIIQAKTQNVVGQPKDPANWDIQWLATNVDLATPGLKRMAICPRFTAGAPIIDYLVDNTSGVGWQLLASVTIDGDQTTGQNATYRYSQNFYMGVVCNATTANSPVITCEDALLPTGPIANPDEPITLIWQPVDGSAITPLVSNSGVEAAARNANKLGQSLGHPEQSSVSAAATAWTTGIDSTEALGATSNNGEYSSLLITCPSLPIQGYIGGAHGSTSALLGVGRVRGNEIKYGFSGEVGENWIQLRNSKPITLYQLAIDIKTDTNHDYMGLESNFSCWIKFRSNSHSRYSHPKTNDVVGVIRA